MRRHVAVERSKMEANGGCEWGEMLGKMLGYVMLCYVFVFSSRSTENVVIIAEQ